MNKNKNLAPKTRLSANLATATIAAIGVSACGASAQHPKKLAAKPPITHRAGHAPRLNPNKPLPRCYNKPLNPPFLPYGDTMNVNESQKQMKKQEIAYNKALKPQKLVLPINNGRPEGMPRLTKNTDTRKAIVKIIFDHGDAFGSGFVTKDAYGDNVVVTAAHVGAGEPIKDYKIINMAGQTTHPTGGCYIYERIVPGKNLIANKDVFQPLPKSDKGSVDVDVAVFTLPAKSLGNTSLKLASATPERGQWVRFTNFELGSTIHKPADYYGLVYQSPPYNSLEAYTGLISYPTPKQARYAEEHNSDYLYGGASGGVVMNSNSTAVVGLSYASPIYPDPLKDVLKINNIEFPGAHSNMQTGFLPVEADLIADKSIEDALNSKRA